MYPSSAHEARIRSACGGAMKKALVFGAVAFGAFGAFTAVAAGAFLACGANNVVIGIESDGGPITHVTTVLPVGRRRFALVVRRLDLLRAGRSIVGQGGIGDAGFTDADWGPCLPDAELPDRSVCEYPADAACTSIGRLPCRRGAPRGSRLPIRRLPPMRWPRRRPDATSIPTPASSPPDPTAAPTSEREPRRDAAARRRTRKIARPATARSP